MFRTLKAICLISCLGLIGSISVLHADQPAKKYTLSIAAVFKNEAKYLKEWVEYHRMIGVDHFYLYNTNSSDQFHEVLHPYIKEGLVTLVNWPQRLRNSDEKHDFLWMLDSKILAYENANKMRAIKDTEWLTLLDIEEFLVPPEGSSLVDLLQKFGDAPGIAIEVDHFDASKFDIAPKRRLVIETVELTSNPEPNPHKAISKMVFKPDHCVAFTWPPYQCVFQDGQKTASLSKAELHVNRYNNRFKGSLYFGQVKDKLHVDNRMLSEEETNLILNEGYQIEDQARPIFRFMPDLLKRLGYETGLSR